MIVAGGVLVAVYGLVARLVFTSKVYGVWSVPTVAPFGPFREQEPLRRVRRARRAREAKELQPFREALHAACGDLRGAAAATCASIALAERSPVGSPPSDFCRVDPARVVQMVPARAKGHTLVEVWDDTLGWTVVDPSGGGLVTGAARRGSAADLLADPASVEWKAFGNASVSAPESEAKRHYFENLLGGDLLYPEPCSTCGGARGSHPGRCAATTHGSVRCL